MIRYFLYTAILVFGVAEVGSAEDKRDIRYVVGPSQYMLRTPGGARRGELYMNTPVEVREERGEWLRVRTEGWVKSKSLRLKSKSAKKPFALQKQGALTVSGYTLKHVSEGLRVPRLYMTLSLKNNSSAVVNSWSGLLVAQSLDGKVLFREPVSDGKANIAPQKIGETIFYWEPRELPYRVLDSAEEGSLKLTLYKIKLNE